MHRRYIRNSRTYRRHRYRRQMAHDNNSHDHIRYMRSVADIRHGLYHPRANAGNATQYCIFWFRRHIDVHSINCHFIHHRRCGDIALILIAARLKFMPLILIA
jgi:hypothetical protein